MNPFDAPPPVYYPGTPIDANNANARMSMDLEAFMAPPPEYCDSMDLEPGMYRSAEGKLMYLAVNTGIDRLRDDIWKTHSRVLYSTFPGGDIRGDPTDIRDFTGVVYAEFKTYDEMFCCLFLPSAEITAKFRWIESAPSTDVSLQNILKHCSKQRKRFIVMRIRDYDARHVNTKKRNPIDIIMPLKVQVG